MELEEIFQSGWEVCLSPNAFVLSAPSKPEAFNLAYCKPEALAEWALRFGRGATLIKYPQCGDSYYRIPAAMANSFWSSSWALTPVPSRQERGNNG